MMIKYIFFLLTLMIFLSLTLSGCGISVDITDSGLPPDDAVNIRIRNDSDTYFRRISLGTGPNNRYPSTHTTQFIAVREGSTTQYAQIEPNVNNYRAMSWESKEDMGINYDDPLTQSNMSEFSTGSYYTYVYDEVDGKIRLIEVIQER